MFQSFTEKKKRKKNFSPSALSKIENYKSHDYKIFQTINFDSKFSRYFPSSL